MFIVVQHKLFREFCIKLFSVQHYFQNCSLSFLHKLFFFHYLKNCSLFSHKTPSEIVFSKFKSQIWMLFHVWISQWMNLFSCIDKIYFYINKICSMYINFTVYSNLFTAFIKLFFALSKTIHCFLIKTVHCFLIKIVHYLKNCSLFSHKTPSEIVFSKFKHQIWMLFHV